MCFEKIKAWFNSLGKEDPPPIPPPPPPPPPPEPVPDNVLVEIKEDTVVFTSHFTNDAGLPIIDVNTGIKTKIGDRWQVLYPFASVDGGNKAGEIYKGESGIVWGRGYYIRKDKFKRLY